MGYYGCIITYKDGEPILPFYFIVVAFTNQIFLMKKIILMCK